MSFVATLFALAVVATAVPAPAQPAVAAVSPTAAAAAVSPAKPVANDDDKVVCKSIAVTGTRFPTHVCATKGQWAQRSVDGRDYADHMSKLGRNCSVGGGC